GGNEQCVSPPEGGRRKSGPALPRNRSRSIHQTGLHRTLEAHCVRRIPRALRDAPRRLHPGPSGRTTPLATATPGLDRTPPRDREVSTAGPGTHPAAAPAERTSDPFSTRRSAAPISTGAARG